jgi:hypothetical protein
MNNFINLEKIMLEYNKIEDNDIFIILSKMPSLRQIFIANNFLSNIPTLACIENGLRFFFYLIYIIIYFCLCMYILFCNKISFFFLYEIKLIILFAKLTSIIAYLFYFLRNQYIQQI